MNPAALAPDFPAQCGNPSNSNNGSGVGFALVQTISS